MIQQNIRLCQVIDHQDYPVSHISLDPNQRNMLMCYKCCEEYKIKADKIEDVFKQYTYKYENLSRFRDLTIKLVKDTINKLSDHLNNTLPEIELMEFYQLEDFKRYVYAADKQKLRIQLREMYNIKELNEEELKSKSNNHISQQLRKFNNDFKPEDSFQQSLINSNSKDLDYLIDNFQYYFEQEEFQFLILQMQNFNYDTQKYESGIGVKRLIQENSFMFYGKVNKNIKNGMGYFYDREKRIFKGGIWKNDNFIYGALYQDQILKLGDISDNMKLNGKGITIYYMLQNTFLGNFKQDVLEGDKCEIINIGNQSRYEGSIKNNQYHGYGTLQEEGSIYTGQFIKGKKNGWGIFRDINNDTIYEGQFENDQLHGFCTKTNNQECQYGIYWNGIENFIHYVSSDQNTPVSEIRVYQMGQLTQSIPNNENIGLAQEQDGYEQGYQNPGFQQQGYQQNFQPQRQRNPQFDKRFQN
ncbi:Phosphatidylinositol 4-phosphate 5-kinase type-1 beta [Paramecium bursaria]